MTDIVKTLSPAEVAAAIADVSKISATAVNVASPKTFIFNAGFDGTNNIKTDLSVSQDKQSTAIGALTDAIPDTANSQTRYYAGLGTPGTLPGSSVNPIQVTAQAIDTAEKAYKDFSLAAKVWYDGNKDGNISVVISTFSRGTITGAIFSQILAERGLTVTDVSGNTVNLIAPGQITISNALVLSPVTTGAIGNVGFGPWGQVSHLAKSATLV